MLTAKDIMTTEVITVQMQTTVNELAEILWKKRISGVPVLDDDGKVVSVVTENDLIDQSKKFHIPTMISLLDSVIFLESSKKTEEEIKKMAGNTVQDICSRELVTVSEETGLDEVATIMANKKCIPCRLCRMTDWSELSAKAISSAQWPLNKPL